ncbi:MAG: aldo/keto reductase [Elusimicrobia bacterium]|nr:aldo/keto reductase [Elusimicrobiota bacterium]
MPMSIGRDGPSEADALSALHAAFDAGTDLVDTADVYCHDDSDIGHNERLIAKAVKSWPGGGKVVVATKGGLTRPEGRWERDARPEVLRAACERSLKALGVSAIALYQLHAPDEKVRFADSVGELKRLKDEGKIRHVGLSNVGLEQLDEALAIVRIESVQNQLHPKDRGDLDDGLVKACAARGVAYLPYCPVGGGYGHISLSKHPTLMALAVKHGISPYCVVLAWHLAQGENVIPIPGASRVESAVDSPKALSVRLEPSDLAVIDALA